MESLNRGQVEMFVNITGASEAEAREKLQAYAGDINAAIDSFLSERESSIAPVHIEEADPSDLMVEHEHPPSHHIAAHPFYPFSSTPAWSSGLPSIRGFGFEGITAPRSPYRRTSPFVSQPRDMREIPIDWKDEEPTVRSNAGLVIEEIPATAEAWPPSQLHPHVVSDDDDDVPRSFSSTLRRNEDRPRYGGGIIRSGLNARHRNANGPLVDEVTDGTTTKEGDDIEEEMLRAALEASEKEVRGKGFSERSSAAGIHGNRSDAEDEDFVRAVSLSLKTAEEEKALREGKVLPWFAALGDLQDDTVNDEVLERKGSPSARDRVIETLAKSLQLDNKKPSRPASHVNVLLRDAVEDTDELEEQALLRRRSARALNPSFRPENMESMVGVRQEARNAAVNPPETMGNVIDNEEWGGLTSEEQEEAVMLEAAMFGGLPDDPAMRLRYPEAVGGNREGANGSFPDSSGYHVENPIEQPPSPSVIAQRLLREQQDDEYLASLVADREKEQKSQCEEELRCLKEAKYTADTKEKLQREKELLKRLDEQERENQKAVKQTALPEEPDAENENAVAIMVRLPDGARQGRRFLKSEPLQCLVDFIDVNCGRLPGSYQLVRPYPRKVFTDAEHARSFQELGFNSKYETLFLEVI